MTDRYIAPPSVLVTATRLAREARQMEDARLHAMNVELTPEEAAILIAVLTFAEGAALRTAPSITEALKYLRPWRSALLREYIARRTTHV